MAFCNKSNYKNLVYVFCFSKFASYSWLIRPILICLFFHIKLHFLLLQASEIHWESKACCFSHSKGREKACSSIYRRECCCLSWSPYRRYMWVELLYYKLIALVSLVCLLILHYITVILAVQFVSAVIILIWSLVPSCTKFLTTWLCAVWRHVLGKSDHIDQVDIAAGKCS